MLLLATTYSPSLLFGARALTQTAQASPASPVRALFINVGKADAALLMLGDQRYLIDTGTEASLDALLKALTGFGVTRLDGVVITHIDSDHEPDVGGYAIPLLRGSQPDDGCERRGF